jgi:hypothetical protein
MTFRATTLQNLIKYIVQIPILYVTYSFFLLAVQIVIKCIAKRKDCFCTLLRHFFETVRQRRFKLRELACVTCMYFCE